MSGKQIQKSRCITRRHHKVVDFHGQKYKLPTNTILNEPCNTFNECRLLTDDHSPGPSVQEYNNFMRRISGPKFEQRYVKFQRDNVYKSDRFDWNYSDGRLFELNDVKEHLTICLDYCSSQLPGHAKLNLDVGLREDVLRTILSFSKEQACFKSILVNSPEELKHTIYDCGQQSKDSYDYNNCDNRWLLYLNRINLANVENQLVYLCLDKHVESPAWETLATRLKVLFLHLTTSGNFLSVSSKLISAWNYSTGKNAARVSEEYLAFVKAIDGKKNGAFDNMIDYTRDYDLDYPGMVKFTRDYVHFLGCPKTPVERPQQTFMRLAIHACGASIYDSNKDCYNIFNGEKMDDKIIDLIGSTYEMLSGRFSTYATPFYTNAGANKSVSSCFLLSVNFDSFQNMMDTCSKITSCTVSGGGIGVDVSLVRSTDSEVSSNSSKPCGVIGFMGCLESVINAANQGSRRGAIAVYLYFCHVEILEFLNCVKPNGKGARYPSLHIGMKIMANLILDAAQNDEHLYLFCPGTVPDLFAAIGDEFERLYNTYVKRKLYVKSILATEFLSKIADCNNEKGEPFFLRMCGLERSNQYHLIKKVPGTRILSNLCTEIIEAVRPGDMISGDMKGGKVGVCNLGSLVLPRYIELKHPSYGIPKSKGNRTLPTKLKTNGTSPCKDQVNGKTYREFITNVNRVKHGIDLDIKIPEELTHWIHPNNGCKYDLRYLWVVTARLCITYKDILDSSCFKDEGVESNNSDMRSIAIGAQGFSDTLQYMMMPFESDEALDLLCAIGETIQHACYTVSAELANKYGSWRFHEGSNFNKGRIPMDFHGTFSKSNDIEAPKPSDELWNPYKLRLNWEPVRKALKKGSYYSQMTSYMPNVSTSVAMGYSPSIEPRAYNIYIISGQNGDLVMFNRPLIELLRSTGRWSNKVRSEIISNKGSVSKLGALTEFEKNVFKTAAEVKQVSRLRLMGALMPFVDHAISSSINVEYMDADRVATVMRSMVKYGLLTSYYVRHNSQSRGPNLICPPSIDTARGKNVIAPSVECKVRTYKNIGLTDSGAIECEGCNG